MWINCRNGLTKNGHTWDIKKFKYQMDNHVFEVNLVLRLVQLIGMFSFQAEKKIFLSSLF